MASFKAVANVTAASVIERGSTGVKSLRDQDSGVLSIGLRFDGGNISRIALQCQTKYNCQS